ncbi:MAG TPA: molybdopterin cofactor-binding domain-containing protein [Ramlibacter sp.]|nr:molybdopterin cofactor-binding domain-containing protein [Ramlibacter sp.]
MDALALAQSTRRDLLKAAALVVGFSLSGLRPAWGQAQAGPRPTLALGEVDSFIALRRDGSAVIYSGKVDLGTGHRIAMRQMVGEELSLPVERIELVEGDSALTPDQGPTAGSSGVMRGGVQLRQAAATLHEALLAMAATRLKAQPEQLTLDDGTVRSADGSKVTVGELAGDRTLNLKMNPKAALKNPARYTQVGKPLPRPDIPAKITGHYVYVHDFALPRMLHARIVRPPAVGAKVLSVDEASISKLPGVRVVRINDFVAVASPDEWAAVRAARELKVQWSESALLVTHQGVVDWARRGPFLAEETLVSKGDAARLAALADAPHKISARYVWPLQSHGSMGPSCAVADVKADSATVWTASQASHRLVKACAAVLDLPPAKVRVVYLDGAGCYGMNGSDDAAAEAAMLSKATGQPVRVQWSREEELGWDPKGPPQLLELRATLTPEGRIDAWETEMWLPRATANLEWIPLLSPQAAGLKQPAGQAVGLVTQNGDPSYPANAMKVHVHWLGAAPLRPSNIRAPGKVANAFAVESFVDELAAQAKADPIQFRLRDLADPRGREVIERLARTMQWQSRPSPRPASAQKIAAGRGMAFVHYKHNETFVAVGMEVEVDRGTGSIRVQRVACAHDCGLMINPDTVRAQVEGNILQTLSRTLHEETTFDRSRVTSVDWTSYPLLRFPEVPRLDIELIQRLDQPPLGAGEAASSPVAAALANAVFDATGVRLRTVPFTKERVKALMT